MALGLRNGLTISRSVCLAALSLAGACNKPSEPMLDVLSISGAIQNVSGRTMPTNARVVAIWAVSAVSQDYDYLFGEGEVDVANGRYTMSFRAPPPAEALNNGQLGVALILLTDDQQITEGKLTSPIGAENVIGIGEEQVIIYLTSGEASASASWARRFSRGYSVGQVERQTAGFDTFAPIASRIINIVVDALSKLRPPNWT